MVCLDRRLLSVLFVISVLAVHTTSAEDIIRDGDRVVFLGDSNTYAGFYVTEIESQLLWQSPDVNIELLNLGLSSETACGLSEPEHPFPRPNVQERAARVMEKLDPDVLVICYGMNDGIYYPFSADRFAAYQNGIRRLVDLAKQAGSRVVLLTPPPFDSQPLRKKGNLLPKQSERFSWMKVYENYDEVMQQYSAWILQQEGTVDRVIDIRTPMVDYLRETRQSDPEYVMSGDGVHFDRVGHRLIAHRILQTCGVSPKQIPQPFYDAVHKRQIMMRDSWLSHVGHKRPGIKAGLPRAEAETEARRMREDLVSMAKQGSAGK